MTGYDYQRLKLIESKISDLELNFSVSGDRFMLYNSDGLMLGAFETVHELLLFVCGYEQGYSRIHKPEPEWVYTA